MSSKRFRFLSRRSSISSPFRYASCSFCFLSLRSSWTSSYPCVHPKLVLPLRFRTCRFAARAPASLLARPLSLVELTGLPDLRLEPRRSRGTIVRWSTAVALEDNSPICMRGKGESSLEEDGMKDMLKKGCC